MFHSVYNFNASTIIVTSRRETHVITRKMCTVVVRDFKFGDITMRLRYTIDQDNCVWFVGRDIAKLLKYQRTQDAIKKHVNVKYKALIKHSPDYDAESSSDSETNLHPQTVLINKSGVIQLIMHSKLPYAVELQEWLLEEVIPQVLSTGRYVCETAPSKSVNDCQSQTVVLLQEISQTMGQLKRDNEDLKKSLVAKDETLKRLATNKDKQIDRLLGDLTRYRKLLYYKEEQVSELREKTVEYPRCEYKQPYLCISKRQTVFTAITGQRKWIDMQKNRLRIDDDSVIVERKRPNPQVDWINLTDNLNEQDFDMSNVKRAKREIEFTSDQDANKFENIIKRVFVNKLQLKSRLEAAP
ncbi:bro-e [Leucania separata nucleopolyhedrovirus]|uniref:Bro-e n=1 Tax=Leucania separata nucleopolyhedrovirus TaxID=1307956 RepID=Q0IL61_NPVLS|nr:bro-e [Leucania separata nucleopolyhedrovirus]AAR28822.1 bro-e [Leucania separata nucleopolyhedrovirus]